jgi:hypothetical protein
MDVYKALRELYEERKRLDSAISVLENRLRKETRPAGRRGRKSMTAAERQEVSRRMSRYWAARRAQLASLNASASAAASGPEATSA